MLTLLSPAKNLNFDPVPRAPRSTKPVFLEDVSTLSETTRKLTKRKIKTLMGISEKLVDLNHARFQAFDETGKSKNTKQAAFAFNGEVYLGLEAQTLSIDDLKFAQEHLRILSGLYGLLRPLDAIQPYRLEMGSRLKNPRGANLYDFWGSNIAEEINKTLKRHDEKTVINLASNEYFSAVDKDTLRADIITPVFKEEKNGKLRALMFFAKRARGMMARWAIENRVENAEDLKKFNGNGYRFSEIDSKGNNWVFKRPQPPKKT